MTVPEMSELSKAMMLNLLVCKMVFSQPMRQEYPVPWMEHIPFAFTVMELHKPGIFVELGTHSGNSYCSFCQAVSHLGLPTKCYAVDTWQGDEQTGYYNDEVFDDLSGYHDPLYGSFSNLLRMRFDDALEYFSDGTIDLLHIDGCHHYEAVKHDFFAWLPRLSSRGVVLLHDSFTRTNAFGVWRLIEELRSSYRIFEFTHGQGLAVVAVGPDVAETTLADLFRQEDRGAVAVRGCFSVLGKRLVDQYQLRSVSSSMSELNAQLVEKDANLRQKDAELANKDAELLGLRGSYSWRMTEPLRRIARHISGLKDRWD